MCMDMPGVVVRCEGPVADVRTDSGIARVATLAVPDIKPGDHVRIVAGVIVERIDPETAAQVVSMLAEARGGST